MVMVWVGDTGSTRCIGVHLPIFQIYPKICASVPIVRLANV